MDCFIPDDYDSDDGVKTQPQPSYPSFSKSSPTVMEEDEGVEVQVLSHEEYGNSGGKARGYLVRYKSLVKTTTNISFAGSEYVSFDDSSTVSTENSTEIDDVKTTSAFESMLSILPSLPTIDELRVVTPEKKVGERQEMSLMDMDDDVDDGDSFCDAPSIISPPASLTGHRTSLGVHDTESRPQYYGGPCHPNIASSNLHCRDSLFDFHQSRNEVFNKGHACTNFSCTNMIFAEDTLETDPTTATCWKIEDPLSFREKVIQVSLFVLHQSHS